MAERLIVKNFGPLKDIDIELKDVNIFIGPTSSGKSTLAKLVAIFKDYNFIETYFNIYDNNYEFDQKKLTLFLQRYNVDFLFKKNTYIELKTGSGFFGYKDGQFINQLNRRQLLIYDVLQRFKEYEEGFNPHLRAIDVKAQIKYFYNRATGEQIDSIEGQEQLDKNTASLISDIKTKLARSNDLYSLKSILIEIIEFIKLKENILDALTPIYIPAERAFISMVANSLFSLISSDIILPRSFKNFGANFEKARNKLKELNIDVLNAQYKFEDNANKVYLSDGEVLKLEQTSSGIQALIPMMLVIKYFSNKEELFNNCFVIGEPELNLYPTMQKALVEFLVENCTKNNNKLIITTHSPYILTALDNLIQAANVIAEKPHLREEVTKLVPEHRWLAFNRVSAYYLADGTARSILDHQMKSIGANNIDDVSEKLGTTFDELLNLRFQES